MSNPKRYVHKCQFPGCRQEIPEENMRRFTKLIHFHGRNILVCKDCGEQYERTVLKAMQMRLAEERAKEIGLTPEQVLSMREEAEAIRLEDEKLVDEEVDVMDKAGVEKAFKKKGDQHEEGKSPLRVMTEKFAEGLRREREKKIIVPGASILPAFSMPNK